MTTNPYHLLGDKAFWKRSVARVSPLDVDPVVDFPTLIQKDTKVATAGSCFAQHIARRLSKSGFNYYVLEKGHEVLSAEGNRQFNYGTFSARYGNLYTTRQLLQLFQRAFGIFTPNEPAWVAKDGNIRDPFRPNIQPGGFDSEASMELDRRSHLRAVRELFSTTDVFVFTLGLTECWRSRYDGAVFPICPGVEGGEFDEDSYEFYNQTVEDVMSDLRMFISLLREVNPTVKLVFTVSPVPLMATARDDTHVLSATVYSKSVLRVAAESIVSETKDAFYFPSFEIITGNFNRGAYYDNDLRSVLEAGVDHVMKLFFKYATNSDTVKTDLSTERPMVNEVRQNGSQSIADIECDEELLDKD